MLASRVQVFTPSITPFKDDYSIDEEALRLHLRRLADAGTGIIMTSALAGESQTLSIAEHRRLYDIAVGECKGTVPVWADVRECPTASGVLEVVAEAVAAGVDAIQVSQCQGRADQPLTEREQEGYWDEVLQDLKVPTYLSLQTGPSGGYHASLALVERLVARYPHVAGIGLYQRGGRPAAGRPYLGWMPSGPFRDWRTQLPARIEILSQIESFQQGSSGTIQAAGNVLPSALVGLASAWNDGRVREFVAAKQLWERWNYAAESMWQTSMDSARLAKAALRFVGLGNGVMRRPLRALTQDTPDGAARLDAVGEAEWHELRSRSRASKKPAPVSESSSRAVRAGETAGQSVLLPVFRTGVMAMTPFKSDYSLDEEALRKHLGRIAATGMPIMLTSPINGESHQLTVAEHRRVYEIGVDVCKGKVPIWSVIRDSASAAAAFEIINEAIAAGVDGVHIYQCRERLLPSEQEAYWVELLDKTPIPVRVSLNELPAGGYIGERRLFLRLVARYEQIVDMWIGAPDGRDFYEWRDSLPPRVQITVGHRDNLYRGANAEIGGAINNILPRTMQDVTDLWNSGDLKGFSAGEQRATEWHRVLHRGLTGTPPHSARVSKAGLMMVGLSNGVVRHPLVAPPVEELAKIAVELDGLGVTEWDALRGDARRKGVALGLS